MEVLLIITTMEGQTTITGAVPARGHTMCTPTTTTGTAISNTATTSKTMSIRPVIRYLLRTLLILLPSKKKVRRNSRSRSSKTSRGPVATLEVKTHLHTKGLEVTVSTGRRAIVTIEMARVTRIKDIKTALAIKIDRTTPNRLNTLRETIWLTAVETRSNTNKISNSPEEVGSNAPTTTTATKEEAGLRITRFSTKTPSSTMNSSR